MRIRPHVRLVAVVLTALVLTAADLPAAPAQSRAADILADARVALGGHARLSAIRSFTIKGAVSSSDGGSHSRTYGSFELACEFPDRFIRVESGTLASAGNPIGAGIFVAGMADSASGPSISGQATTLGFAGDRLIYRPSLRYHHPNKYNWPPKLPSQEELRPFLRSARQDFVEVTLGIFAASFPSVPLQFLDLPVERGRAIDVQGEGGVVTMTFDPVTHLPQTLNRLVYDDYREVDGIKVPFRLARLGAQVRGGEPGTRKVQTEFRIKEIRFNVTIPPKVFKP